MTLSGGESKTLLCYPPAGMREAFEVAVAHGKETRLCFIGFLKYIDQANNTRETGFMRRYNWGSQSFDVADNPDYEYQG